MKNQRSLAVSFVALAFAAAAMSSGAPRPPSANQSASAHKNQEKQKKPAEGPPGDAAKPDTGSAQKPADASSRMAHGTSKSNDDSGTAPRAPTPADSPTSTADTEAGVQPPPPKIVVVWVNTASKVYHKPGSRWYGKTKHGRYMTEKDAIKAGYRLAGKE